MNTTETTPGDIAAEAPEPSREAPRPEAAEPASGAVPDAAADAGADGGPAPEHGDRPPRPRRRRRRRRKPVPGMMTAGPAVADDDAALAEAPPADGATTEAGDGEPDGSAATPRGILHLRNRRRRRRPHAPGLAPGTAEPAAAADGATEGPAGDEAAVPVVPGFRAPRRRRRHAPLSASTGAETGGAASPGGEAGQGAARPARSRNRRRRRAAPAEGATGAAGEGQAREARSGTRGPGSRDRSAGPSPGSGEGHEGRRDGAPRGAGPRADRGDRRRDDRRSGPSRGRGTGPSRPTERKLYSTDAVVDRGFEDIEQEGEEVRRVHWTIVKRTTADQISRKAISAVYVLQRDGEDTEFPNLGAARSAVNKTIVHPEKLTLSKAEHAAAKK